MKTVALTLRYAAWLMALSILLPWSNASRGGTATGEVTTRAPAPDLYPDMVRELFAAGPNPSLGYQATVMDRLVGTWSVEYNFISKNGKVKHETGEYIAAWVMNGRAIQDIWTVNPSTERKNKDVYTTLLYVDSKLGTWYASWFDPEHALVARFTGAATGNNQIVILTHDFSDKNGDVEDRWSFNEIGPVSFVFHDEESRDGGKTWRLAEVDHMTRRGANSAATVMRSVLHPSTGAY